MARWTDQNPQMRRGQPATSRDVQHRYVGWQQYRYSPQGRIEAMIDAVYEFHLCMDMGYWIEPERFFGR